MPIWAHTGHMFSEAKDVVCLHAGLYIRHMCIYQSTALYIVWFSVYHFILDQWALAQTKGPFYFEIVIYEMGINLFTNIEPMVDQKRVSTK